MRAAPVSAASRSPNPGRLRWAYKSTRRDATEGMITVVSASTQVCPSVPNGVTICIKPGTGAQLTGN